MTVEQMQYLADLIAGASAVLAFGLGYIGGYLQ